MQRTVSPNEDLSNLFDANYYRTGLGFPYERNDHWLNFFGAIADEIIRSLKPQTVFDAGCAMGFLVESLWDRGVEAYGVDVSSFAISQVRRDVQRHCREGSLVDPIEGRYDLVTCIEVLEHLLPEETEAVIGNLAAITDTILFSSSPTDVTEATHFNVRPVIGWLKLFAEAGFSPDCVFDASFVAPHAMLLRKQQQPSSEDILALFSEKTRLKCALVEREQRIGNLNQKIIDLAPSREEHNRATAELLAIREEHRRVSGELLAYRDKNEELFNELSKAINEYQRVSRELQVLQDRHKQMCAELFTLQRSDGQIRRDVATLQRERGLMLRELTAVHARRIEAEKSAGEAQNRAVETELETNRLQEELAHIGRSAAWQFTLRYRAWIESRRATSRLLRLYDKSAKWLIRKARLSAAQPILARPAEIPADSTPATVYSVNTAIVPIEITNPESALSEAPKSAYENWFAENEPTPELLELQHAISLNLHLQPLISVLVPVYDVPLEVLQELIESVLAQSYPNWELCMVHAYPSDVKGREYLTFVAAQDSRVKVQLLETNEGISSNSNVALRSVQGEFVALLDHDDTLAPFALFEIAIALNEQPGADFFYSDKDTLTEDGRRVRPLFKPAWSPDILLSANYLTHLSVMRTDIVRAIGGWRSETDGAQDWDIFLRAADHGARIVFVPGVLYHWRIISTSVAFSGLRAKPYASKAQIRAVDDHAERLGLRARGSIEANGTFKMNWTGAEDHSVGIILVSSSFNADLLRDWILQIDDTTEWPRVEIVAPGWNYSDSRERIRSSPSDESDSVAVRLNRAVEATSGEYLVFLDESVDIRQSDWLRELVGPLEQSAVGIVGAKLLDSRDSTLRHAGLVFNADGALDYILSHEPEHVCEQFGPAVWYRDWSAVAGACFAIRRETFESVGGFREHPDYPRHDVDLCLRIGVQFGYRVFYNPFAKFFQSKDSLLELWLSPNGPRTGAGYIRACFPAGDPFFHKRLESRSGKVLFSSNKGALAQNDYAAESRALVAGFDAAPEIIEISKTGSSGPREHVINRLTWILPEFHHAFYGGVYTILRFADYFHRRHNVESEFVFPGMVPEKIMQSRLARAFPNLIASARVTQLRSETDWDRVRPSDASISTLWTTAYAALRFRATRRKFYFVQDYESLFYPAGSIYALVEATYRFGYYGICNTRSVAEMYREFGGEAEYFDPCIDGEYFFESEQPRDESYPLRLFCYARPGHPRNCFELLGEALKRLKQRMGDDVRIYSAGAEWDPSDYGLKGIIENLGLLGYSATGALYRTCDVGVVMMMTHHPSYLPLELMACGSLVITNENRYTRWLLEHEQNCLLSQTSPGALTQVIERGLRDRTLRKNITQRAAEQVRSQYSNWDAQAEKIYEYMVANS